MVLGAILGIVGTVASVSSANRASRNSAAQAAKARAEAEKAALERLRLADKDAARIDREIDIETESYLRRVDANRREQLSINRQREADRRARGYQEDDYESQLKQFRNEYNARRQDIEFDEISTFREKEKDIRAHEKFRSDLNRKLDLNAQDYFDSIRAIDQALYQEERRETQEDVQHFLREAASGSSSSGIHTFTNNSNPLTMYLEQDRGLVNERYIEATADLNLQFDYEHAEFQQRQKEYERLSSRLGRKKYELGTQFQNQYSDLQRREIQAKREHAYTQREYDIAHKEYDIRGKDLNWEHEITKETLRFRREMALEQGKMNAMDIRRGGMSAAFQHQQQAQLLKNQATSSLIQGGIQLHNQFRNYQDSNPTGGSNPTFTDFLFGR